MLERCRDCKFFRYLESGDPNLNVEKLHWYDTFYCDGKCTAKKIGYVGNAYGSSYQHRCFHFEKKSEEQVDMFRDL